MIKRLLLALVFVGALMVLAQYLQMDESHKRRFHYLARQVPYLPARYFV